MATLTVTDSMESGGLTSTATFTLTYTVSSNASTTTLTLNKLVTSISSGGYRRNPTWEVYADGTKLGSQTISGAGTYTFSNVTKSWSRGGSSATKKLQLSLSGYNISSSANITVPAHDPYTITFNANGGTGGPTTQQKTHGTNLTLTTSKPSFNGYTFKRWNTNTSDTGTGYDSGGTYTANASATLYAIWNRTVTFNANGGTGAPSAQTAIKTSAITLSSTKPTWSGYTFKRWNTNTSDTGTSYNPGGSYAANNPSVTLYAIWNHVITYNANGGQLGNIPGSQTDLKTNAITLNTNSPTFTGYNFVRWNTNTSNTGTSYNPGDSYAANSTNITLYAIWNRTVTFNANGGTGAPTAQTSLKTDAITLSSNVPTKENYVFKGWATTNTGTPVYQPNGTYPKDMPSQTLYAVWAPVVSITNITRTDVNGNSDIFGGYVKVDFTYTNESQTGSIQISGANLDLTESFTQTSSEISITSKSIIIGNNMVNPENNYNIVLIIPGGTQVNDDTVIRYTLEKTNYIRPMITSILTERVNQNYKLADDGTFLRLSVNWSVFNSPTQIADIKVSAKEDNGKTVDISSYQPNLNELSGKPSVFYFPRVEEDGYYYFLTEDTQIDSSKDYYIKSNNEYVSIAEPTISNINTYYERSTVGLFSTDNNYIITIELSDALGESVKTSKSDILSKSFFTMDVLGDAYYYQESEDTVAGITKTYYEKNNGIYEPVDFSEYDNLMHTAPDTETTSAYMAYEVTLDEWLEAEQEYTLQLWDVDVSHSGKTESELGVVAYYCGGTVVLGGWAGTNDFTNGHADHLVMTFTPHDSDRTTYDGSFEWPSSWSGTNGLTHSTVTDATNPFIRLYNSPVSATGTMNLTVGAWKLEKGSTGTSWSNAIGDFNPVDEGWYEKNGPRPGYGLAFGMPATHEAFNIAMPPECYGEPWIPTFKTNSLTNFVIPSKVEECFVYDTETEGSYWYNGNTYKQLTYGEPWVPMFQTNAIANFTPPNEVTECLVYEISRDRIYKWEADGKHAVYGPFVLDEYPAYWHGSQNIRCEAKANGQEWSFDLCEGTTSFTGTYGQFWSSKLSKSIMRFYADDCMSEAYGTFRTIDASIHIKSSTWNRGTTPSTNQYKTVEFRDAADRRVSQIESFAGTSGEVALQLYVLGHHTQSDQYSGFRIVKNLNNTGTANMVFNANTGALNAPRFLLNTGAKSYVAGAKGETSLYKPHTYNTAAWDPCWVVQTKGGGSWSCGNYNDEALQFCYFTKALIDAQTNSGQKFVYFLADGRVQAAGFPTSSDRRLKEHISYLGEEAVYFIKSLLPAKFKMDETTKLGFYAQDIEDDEIYEADLVSIMGEDEMRSLDYNQLIAPLVATVQNLTQRVEELEERIKELEERIGE